MSNQTKTPQTQKEKILREEAMVAILSVPSSPNPSVAVTQAMWLTILADLEDISSVLRTAKCDEMGFWIAKLLDLYEYASFYGHLRRQIQPPPPPFMFNSCEEKRGAYLSFAAKLREALTAPRFA